MKLENYISDLLYRYECVIVPNFGGFVTNNKSSKIDAASNTFQPPCKQITFNGHLKNNDGLLANYITSVAKIDYDAALDFIKNELKTWRKELNLHDLVLKTIGTLTLVDDKLIFEPEQKVNYLTTSFGLSHVVSQEIKREVYTREVEKIEKKAPIYIHTKTRKSRGYLKYAAIFVIGLSAIGFGNKWYQTNKNNQVIASAKAQQKIVDKKIETATFVISKPLPTLELEVTKKEENFHIIAGAFRNANNANKKVEELLEQGYNARIVGINKWNLTMVSYDSFTTREEAYENLDVIKANVAKSAWLLVKEL